MAWRSSPQGMAAHIVDTSFVGAAQGRLGEILREISRMVVGPQHPLSVFFLKQIP